MASYEIQWRNPHPDTKIVGGRLHTSPSWWQFFTFHKDEMVLLNEDYQWQSQENGLIPHGSKKSNYLFQALTTKCLNAKAYQAFQNL